MENGTLDIHEMMVDFDLILKEIIIHGEKWIMRQKMEDKSKQLAQAILSLQTEEECFDLLNDLLTFKETEDLVNRFCIAVLLDQGKTFLDVEFETGASSATISRVNRCLKYGKGYRTAIDRLKAEKRGENDAGFSEIS